jgi:four helix bundle protein
MRDHGRLEAFRLADALALRVYELTRSFPAVEKFGLIAQLRRAAVSIAANIVEGSARLSQSEYVRFLNIAYGSAKELQYELSLSHRLGYLVDPETESLASRTSRALWALISSLRGRNTVARSP